MRNSIERINHALRRAYIVQCANTRRRQLEDLRRQEQEEEDAGYEHLDNAARLGARADRIEQTYHTSLNAASERVEIRA